MEKRMEYVSPEIEIIEFEAEDIIVTSGADGQEDINEYYEWPDE